MRFEGAPEIYYWYMTRVAKLFRNGRSQAVRLPAEFRFSTKRVSILRGAIKGSHFGRVSRVPVVPLAANTHTSALPSNR